MRLDEHAEEYKQGEKYEKQTPATRVGKFGGNCGVAQVCRSWIGWRFYIGRHCRDIDGRARLRLLLESRYYTHERAASVAVHTWNLYESHTTRR